MSSAVRSLLVSPGATETSSVDEAMDDCRSNSELWLKMTCRRVWREEGQVERKVSVRVEVVVVVVVMLRGGAC